MEWELLDENGELIQYVNCDYDAIDIGTLMYGATIIEIDFNKCVATIKERENIKGVESNVGKR